MDSKGFPSLSTWLDWHSAKVAQQISGLSRPLVVGWPYNGTRRWYLSYRHRYHGNEDYLHALTRRQAEVSRMIFDHGVRVLLIPLFGNALLERGRAYATYGLNGLQLLGENSVYTEMYDAGVRLRFYGDYVEPLDGLGLAHVIDFCRRLESDTAAGDGPLLLIGLFAENPHSCIASIVIEFAEQYGRSPNRQELIEAYYGVPVSDLSLYIGYAQHTLFDVPLITTGREDLYVTLNPSPSMTERQLREILYDHLVTRQTAEVDYEKLSPQGRHALASHVDLYEGVSLGLGRIDPLTRTWVPSLPDDPLRGR